MIETFRERERDDNYTEMFAIFAHKQKDPKLPAEVFSVSIFLKT